MHRRVDLPQGSGDKLSLKVELISNNPVVNGLLHLTSGLLAVLDEQRCILSVNDALLRRLGFGSAQEVIGLRTGEAFQCSHAHDVPGGCGEGPFCQTCGAAIAIVIGLTQGVPVERTCALSRCSEGVDRDLCLRVQSCPLRIDNHRILLLFIQDITSEQQACAVRRVFFHDVANTVNALDAFSESLLRKADSRKNPAALQIASLVRRLDMEISMQRALTDPEHFVYRQRTEPVAISRLIAEVAEMIQAHPCSRGRQLVFPHPVPEIELQTDSALLMRVLTNMLINAFEAPDSSREVRLWVDVDPKQLSICVWNDQPIDENLARRIFQRNFSTKAALGRGLGTYSMKLFAERFLHGNVAFTTSPREGTTFRVTLPRT